MKTEKELEDFLDSLKIPTAEEVEAAGVRFERRIRRLRLWRRVLWSSGAAAVVLVGLLVIPWWGEQGEKEIAGLAREHEMPGEILVPTLILSDGGRVDLTEAKDAMLTESCQNIRVKGNRIIYDAKPDTVAMKINTLVIPAGYIYNLTLADGTEVTLNAGSRLEYPEAFTGERREVRLAGEAYFRIAKSGMPFEVNAENATVRVYGTQFNMKTRQGDMVETVLVEGKVGFIPAEGEEVWMVPGQGVEYDGQSGRLEVHPVDVACAIAWMGGVFKYRDCPLRLVMQDVAAWYGVEFDVQGEALTVELTMSLEKNTPLEETLQFIEQITACQIKQERGVYIVK